MVPWVVELCIVMVVHARPSAREETTRPLVHSPPIHFSLYPHAAGVVAAASAFIVGKTMTATGEAKVKFVIEGALHVLHMSDEVVKLGSRRRQREYGSFT